MLGRKIEDQFDCQCGEAILGLKGKGATRPNPTLMKSHMSKQMR